MLITGNVWRILRKLGRHILYGNYPLWLVRVVTVDGGREADRWAGGVWMPTTVSRSDAGRSAVVPRRWRRLSAGHLHAMRLSGPCQSSKGVFIATQLNSTQLNSTELNSTAWTTVDSVCRSWRHKQKHDWLGCTLFNWVSWVQLSSVELSWVVSL